MVKKQAIIFDLDGTLIDSIAYHHEAYVQALKKLGIKLSRQDFVKLVGIPAHDILKIILEKHGQSDMLAQVYQEKYTLADAHPERVKLMKHAKEILKWCQSNNIPVALATSSAKDFVIKILRYHRIIQYFEAILSWEDVANPKPNPEIFESAARILGVDKKVALIVEDAEIGIVAAKKGKIEIAALIGTNTRKQLENLPFKPDYIIEDLLEVKKFF